jgi:hypothetical protein
MEVGDKKLYVFNAFFMSMRSKFVGEANSIYYYSVEWDPAKLSWADFRGKTLGPTNPADAPAGAIRAEILARWQEFGTLRTCNGRARPTNSLSLSLFLSFSLSLSRARFALAVGLSAEPNQGDNGVHASASPLEGLAEKMNWLEKGVADETFGAALLRNGLSEETVKAWSVDPRVDMEGGAASIFDTLEDLSVGDCLAKCVEVNGFKPAE